jgi:hypothetical protein
VKRCCLSKPGPSIRTRTLHRAVPVCNAKASAPNPTCNAPFRRLKRSLEKAAQSKGLATARFFEKK